MQIKRRNRKNKKIGSGVPKRDGVRCQRGEIDNSQGLPERMKDAQLQGKNDNEPKLAMFKESYT